MGDLYAPYVTAQVKLGARTIEKIDFLVDSGASRSLVPRFLVSDLFAPALLHAPTEAASDMKDASGKCLQGFDIDFDIKVSGAPALPVAHERVFVGRDLKFPVLGMSWFEKVGVHFQNFPDAPRGRQFALYLAR